MMMFDDLFSLSFYFALSCVQVTSGTLYNPKLLNSQLTWAHSGLLPDVQLCAEELKNVKDQPD